MADPTSYVAPSIGPYSALAVASFALWVWPIVVVGVTAFVRWGKLRYRVGFVVLAYLVCVGISAMIGRIGGVLTWAWFIPRGPQDQIVVALVNASIGQTIVGVVVSPIPVIWLALLLSERDAHAI